MFSIRAIYLLFPSFSVSVNPVYDLGIHIWNYAEAIWIQYLDSNFIQLFLKVSKKKYSSFMNVQRHLWKHVVSRQEVEAGCWPLHHLHVVMPWAPSHPQIPLSTFPGVSVLLGQMVAKALGKGIGLILE